MALTDLSDSVSSKFSNQYFATLIRQSYQVQSRSKFINDTGKLKAIKTTKEKCSVNKGGKGNTTIILHISEYKEKMKFQNNVITALNKGTSPTPTSEKFTFKVFNLFFFKYLWLA